MRPSTTLRLGAVVAAASLALAACGGSGGSGESGSGSDSGSGYIEVVENPQFEDGTTMAELAEAGTVTIGTKFKQPLFGQQQLDGSMAGFDVEIAKIIAGQLGISPDQINWKKTPSKIREQVIEQDAVDYVVATYTINDERAQRVSFAGPYYLAGQSLMVRKDYNKVSGPESLKDSGARVCTARGSTSYQNIKEYVTKNQLTLFESYEQCANALGEKQVDVVTTDNVILLGLVSKSDGAYKMVGDRFTDEPYGVGIPKGDTAFCEFVNNALKKAAESGAYAKAWKKTAGEYVEKAPELPEPNECA